MPKLNQKKIDWIIRHKDRHMATREVAISQRVTRRRVQQLYRQYRETGVVPMLKTNRRPGKDLDGREKRIIEEAYEQTRLGAKLLRQHIKVHHGIDINHNRIHRHLVAAKLAERDPRKQKKRSRCRYEREHSFSLLHGDWFEWKGKHLVGFSDDASRRMLALGEFEEATGKNTIETFREAEKAAAENSTHITEVNTDRGSQFYANKWRKKGLKGASEFERYLDSRGIRHVPSRRTNPQTNGKFERWIQEFKKHRGRFGSADEFTEWYNNRMHGSLNLEWAETPNQALLRKLRHEALLGLFYRNVARKG